MIFECGMLNKNKAGAKFFCLPEANRRKNDGQYIYEISRRTVKSAYFEL